MERSDVCIDAELVSSFYFGRCTSKSIPPPLKVQNGAKPQPNGEVSRGEKMAVRGTDPKSYITQYTSVYEDYSAERVVPREPTCDVERSDIYLG